MPAVMRNQVYDEEKLGRIVGKVVEEILGIGRNYGPVSSKVLLARYISLPSMMG